MRTLNALLAFCFLFTDPLLAQQEESNKCTDIAYLRGGTILQGKVLEYNLDSNLVFTTWGGATMTIPAGAVLKVKQRCPRGKRLPQSYDFKEQGLYNATRVGTLVGQTYFGDNTTGFNFYHSIGWMFNRWVGAGIGGGVEMFNPEGGEPATYPVFAEVRGYLLAKNTTPFYALGGGWGFAGKNSNSSWGSADEWRGGWMAKAQLGYRLGNHFTAYGGLSFQKKTRVWNSTWGGEWGQDRILHKRLELGIGLLL